MGPFAVGPGVSRARVGTLRVRSHRILRRENIRERDGKGRRRRCPDRFDLGEMSVESREGGGDQGGNVRARDVGTRRTEPVDVQSPMRRSDEHVRGGYEARVFCDGGLGYLRAVRRP